MTLSTSGTNMVYVGPLRTHSLRLLERYQLMLTALSQPAIQAELEPKFAPFLATEPLVAAATNLQTKYAEFQARYDAAKAQVATAQAEQHTALAGVETETEAAKQAVATELDPEIAALTARLEELKKTKAARIAAVKAAAQTKNATIRDAAKTKVERYAAEGRTLSGALAAAYQTADEAYRAAEGIWIANCNEKSKRELVHQVFPATLPKIASTAPVAAAAGESAPVAARTVSIPAESVAAAPAADLFAAAAPTAGTEPTATLAS